MVELLGIVYEILILSLSLLLFFKLLHIQTRYYLVYVTIMMLFAEIQGTSTGLATYNQEFFSLYIAGIPLIMPFVWFVFVGLATFVSQGRLVYFKVFIAAIFLDLLLELPMVYFGAWRNNFGVIKIIEGHPFILLIMYSFLAIWFNWMLRNLAPKLEARKMRNSGLLFALVFILTYMVFGLSLIFLVPI